ncbi:Uncharacterised protein [Corynebacterium striatum]|uniref:Secreted protein n=1 Tax=Corynebacterium striatum TaxID=43770 RepID=A0AAQ1TTP6_CORST|nr:hypothetical protein [Corynebacterium striatum]QQE52576.1 hypothetical protein I6I11_10765 [Corynebacterium striatum]GEA42704.1 hypothetical protein Cst04h_08740 [Corynebacterium striatum]STD56948.1 Uncharacterised protein [Corynebacterium striatum]
MSLFRKAVVTVALISTVAISGSPAFAASVGDQPVNGAAKVVDASFTKIYTKKSTNNGMVLSIENGTITENKDGSVTIANADGSEAKLKSAFLLSDGSVSKVTYRVDGNVITASYSKPLAEGGVVPVVSQGAFGCAMGTIATIGSLASIPLTAGADAWPAILLAGSAAGTASYECARIGR